MKNKNNLFITGLLISLFLAPVVHGDNRNDNKLFLYANLHGSSILYPENLYYEPVNPAVECEAEKIVSEKLGKLLDQNAREQLEERLETNEIYLKPFYFKLKVLELHVSQPKEIEEYYNQNIKLFTTPGKRDIWYLFISSYVSENKQDWEKAEREKSLAEKILKTKTLDSLKDDYNSNDYFGNKCKKIENVPKGQFAREVEDVIFSLKQGEESDFVKTPKGFIKIKMLKIAPDEIKSLEQAKISVMGRLAKQTKDKILENIRQNAFKKNQISYDFTKWNAKTLEERTKELKNVCAKLVLDPKIVDSFKKLDFKEAVLNVVLTHEFDELDNKDKEDYELLKIFTKNRWTCLKALELQAMEEVDKPMTEDELKNFYNENPNNFYQRGKIIARMATIKSKSKDKDFRLAKLSAEESANAFYEKLKKGEDFAALAKQFSADPLAEKGGYIGEVDEENSTMGAIFDINAFDLKEGEYTKPLYRYTKNDYILLKADKILREKKLLPFSEVRAKVEKVYKDREHGDRVMELADKYFKIAKENLGNKYDNAPPIFLFFLPLK